MSGMSETKEAKRAKIIEEFRRRGANIPVKEHTDGPVLDNGYSGEFTELWKWCQEELRKIEEEPE